MLLSINEQNKKIVFRNFEKFFSLAIPDVHKQYDCRYTLSPTNNPIFNSVLAVEADSSNIDYAVDSVAKFYQARKKSHCWWLTDWDEKNHLGQKLEARGYQKGDAFSGMVCELKKELTFQEFDPAIDIKQISNIEDLGILVEMIQVAFEFDQEATQFYLKTFEQLFSNPKFQHVLAYYNGVPAGCGTLFFTEDSVGFYNLAVLPEFRHKKIASAIQQYRLTVSKATGYRYAVLQASNMAENLDKRLGFKSVMQFTPYILN